MKVICPIVAKKELKDMYDSKGKLKRPCLDPKQDGLSKERSQQNIFFNLEKKNYDRKIIKELKDENDKIITNFKDINRRIEDHFSKILSSKIAENENVQRLNFNQFVKDVEIPKLTNEEQTEMEMIFQWRKLKKVVTLFQKTKTPGDDGFSVEFYEAFIDMLGGNLLDCHNEYSTKINSQYHQEEELFPLYPGVKKTWMK